MANIFRTASLWLKGAIILFAVGLLLFIIGFATNAWRVTGHSYLYDSRGLWQRYYCTYQRSCVTHTYHSAELNAYHQAIQAMECLGLIGYLLAILILLLYLCVDSCRRKDFLQATIAITFAGFTCACIGFALFDTSSNHENKYGYGEIGWSMGLAIAGTVAYGIGGIFLIVHLIR